MRFTTVCLLALVFCACGTLDRVIQLQAQEVKEKKEEKEEKKRIGGWEVQEVVFMSDKTMCTVGLRVKNTSTETIGLPKSLKDASFAKRKQHDLNHPASSCVMRDASLDLYRAFWVLSADDSGEQVKPGDTGNLILHFPPVSLSSKYTLQIPGELIGLKGIQSLEVNTQEVKIVTPKKQSK